MSSRSISVSVSGALALGCWAEKAALSECFEGGSILSCTMQISFLSGGAALRCEEMKHACCVLLFRA